jgi:hypothetical protein
MRHLLMAGNYCLNSQLLNLLPALIARLHIWISLRRFVNVLEDWGKRPLVTLVVLSLVLLEVFRIFVDRVVRKVHVEVGQVAAHGRYILWCCKSGQAFMVHKNSQWSYTCYKHVDSKVKFQSIY